MKKSGWTQAILIIALIGICSTSIFFLVRKTLRSDNSQPNLDLTNLEFVESSTAIKKGKSILLFFHPSCDFCQRDAEQFRKSYMELKDLEVLWVSYDDQDSIRKFSQDYGLDTIPNMHFAYMDIEAMIARYGNVKFPTFLAYDEKGQLLRKFVGLTKPEEILKAYLIE